MYVESSHKRRKGSSTAPSTVLPVTEISKKGPYVTCQTGSVYKYSGRIYKKLSLPYI